MSNVNDVSRPLALDLFSGCGGISVGLRAAGFKVIAGVDSEPKYLVSFAQNFPEALALGENLIELSPPQLMELLKIEPGQIDLVAGGPPCQGFSKNVPRKLRYLEDPRNLLVKRFLDYCEAVEPRFVLMENVAEMRNGFDQAYSDEIIGRLERAHYSVTPVVLNAADFGVPQRRRRAFFLAHRGTSEVLPPRPTHRAAHEGVQAELLQPTPHVSVWDAIGDLPSLQHGEGIERVAYPQPPQSDYQRWSRTGSQFLSNHIARRLQPLQWERLAALEPGENLKNLPDHLKVRSGFSGAYGRLTKEMVAPTITRWVFHPGSGRWGHPIDIRILTIREAARLQSFPDKFEFAGSYTQQAGQLGNAVPPLLAQRIGERFLSLKVRVPRASQLVSQQSTAEKLEAIESELS